MIESIFIKNVATYNSSGIYINGLKKINFIYGANGCGKTTLLYLLGFLEKKDQGSILIDDKEPKSIQKLYKHTIGFLFQNYALIENETIEQNLKMILKEKSKLKSK